MGWFASFLYSQFFVTLPKPTKDFTGQTIIITGSNTGLGLEAARHFSELNCTLLILAVRTQSKGEAAKQSILASTGRPPSSIEVWELDMQSYESIAAFCAKVDKLPRLDAVLENAGIGTKHFKMVAGYESTITTNVIGTFLLALGVLPKLRKSAKEYRVQGRLSIVASDLHFIAKFPERENEDIFIALNDEKADMSMERYAVSKLIQVAVVSELASHMADDPKSTSPTVIVNCMTPGACKSDFDRESTGVRRFINNLMAALIARTTEAGSRTLLAAVAAGEESHGKFMADCHVSEHVACFLTQALCALGNSVANTVFRVGPMLRGPDGVALQKKIWDQVVQQLESIQPGISGNI